MNQPENVFPTPGPVAGLRWEPGEGERRSLELSGAWTVQGLGQVPELRAPQGCREVRLCAPLGALRIDTAGARILTRAWEAWERAGIAVQPDGLEPAQRQLLQLVRERALELPQVPRRAHAGVLGDIGRGVVTAAGEGRRFVAFFGELVWRGVPLVLHARRLRWREIAAEIEAGGLRAVGIVGLLSFLIGMVMAYQGGATLATYGANILIVNLVSILTLREMGPLLAAILVAGRTGSSYTAQLGTMRITEEIDALRALGLSPFEILVLPKVLALMVVLPLLSLLADAMGLLGGGLVASLGFGVPWREYVARIPQVVHVDTLLLGLAKAPVFAVVIALVGCLQGLRVRGSAAAVGHATTVSVVQAIFLVIVIDAAFSILYKALGL